MNGIKREGGREMESWRGKGDREEREDGEVESKMEKGLGRGKGGKGMWRVRDRGVGAGKWEAGRERREGAGERMAFT